MATYRKEDRLCESCGVIFKGRRDAKYCSSRCRVYASARRKEDNRKGKPIFDALGPYKEPDKITWDGGNLPDVEHIQAGEE